MSPPYFDFSEIKDSVQREEKREYIEDYFYSRLGDLTERVLPQWLPRDAQFLPLSFIFVYELGGLWTV